MSMIIGVVFIVMVGVTTSMETSSSVSYDPGLLLFPIFFISVFTFFSLWYVKEFIENINKYQWWNEYFKTHIIRIFIVFSIITFLCLIVGVGVLGWIFFGVVSVLLYSFFVLRNLNKKYYG